MTVGPTAKIFVVTDYALRLLLSNQMFEIICTPTNYSESSLGVFEFTHHQKLKH